MLAVFVIDLINEKKMLVGEESTSFHPKVNKMCAPPPFLSVQLAKI